MKKKRRVDGLVGIHAPKRLIDRENAVHQMAIDMRNLEPSPLTTTTTTKLFHERCAERAFPP